MKIIGRFKAVFSSVLVWLLIVVAPANSFARGATSNQSAVAQTSYTATVATAQTATGSTITVNWTAPANYSADDYIRLAQVNQADNSYSWSQALGSAGSGSFTVTVPNVVARYEFRIYRASDQTRVATSTSFVANLAGFSATVTPLTIAAGGQITVGWSAPAGRANTDSIRIASATGASSSYISQQYTNGVYPGSIKIAAPSQPGNYEVRYFKQNESEPAALSSVLTVVAAAGEFAGQVKQGETGEPLSGALVEVQQNNTTKAAFTTQSSGSFNIPVAATGTYSLKVSATNFGTVTRSNLNVSSGNATIANFELFKTGTLAGKITNSASGSSVSGASLRVKQGSTLRASGSTDASGNYSFANLSAGSYTVEVSAIGFQAQTKSNISITANRLTALNVALVASATSATNLIEYVYDEAGRLVATKEGGVVKNIYSYDSAGNLLAIVTPPPSAPAIISFSPSIGLPGTQVTIRGVNFSATAAQNTVKFNGTSASVTSASTSEIVTVVPSAATTGAISVTTASGTTISSAPFVIAQNPNAAPTITGFSPTIGRAGDAVTITGSNFESEPSENTVLFGANPTGVAAATTSSLTVGANTSSGKITVTTPNGTAKSQNDFFSVPSSISPANVAYAERTWFGHNKGVNFSGADKVGALVFDGVAGKRFSIQLFQLSNHVKIDVYRPDGRSMSSSSFYSGQAPESWFIDTQTFPLTGTYTLIITPLASTAATTFSLKIYDVPPDVTGEVPINSGRTVFIGTPGQNGVLTFNATAGQKVSINIEDSTHSGTASIFKAIPTVIGAPTPPTPPALTYVSYVQLLGRSTLDGTTIPATGTYTLNLDPAGPNIGAMTATVYLAPPDPTFSTSIGSRFGVQVAKPPEPPPGTGIIGSCAWLCIGQNAWFKFQGTAGQRISLLRRDNTNMSSVGTVNVSINKPNGQFLVSITQTNNGSFIDTVTLPETGEYKILIDPQGGSIGTADFDFFGVPADVTGTLAIAGDARTYATTVPGQNMALTFDNSVANQQISLTSSEVTIPNGALIFITKPDGTNLTYTGASINNVSTTNIQLAQIGTYKLLVDPQAAGIGSLTLQIGGIAAQNVRWIQLAPSVSVMRGAASGSTADLSAAVSVNYSNVQTQSPSASVSVTTGPHVTGRSPVNIAKGTSATLTVNGANLIGASAIRFFDGNGALDTNFTVTNISVNAAGTTLTATITVNSAAAVGERVLVVVTPRGTSRGEREATAVNTISVIQ